MSERLCNLMVRGIPDDLRWQLRAIAARRHEPMSAIFIRLIREYVERETREGRGEL